MDALHAISGQRVQRAFDPRPVDPAGSKSPTSAVA